MIKKLSANLIRSAPYRDFKIGLIRSHPQAIITVFYAPQTYPSRRLNYAYCFFRFGKLTID